MIFIRINRIAAVIVTAAAVAAAITVGGIHKATERVTADAQGAVGVRVPILMYHLVLENSDGNRYTVSPAAFAADLKYLNEQGYTSIMMRDLIDYVYEGTELPQKPVILTFDDGYYNNYAYVYPLLKEYDARAVISVVGAYTDKYSGIDDTNVNYAYLTWDNLKEMTESGYVEIQNHTYDLHSLDKGRQGCKKKNGEGESEYKAMLNHDLSMVQEECREHLGKAPDTFTYPYGFISDESLEVVRSLGFKASLTCNEGINIIERRPDALYLLKRCIRTPRRGAADICGE